MFEPFAQTYWQRPWGLIESLRMQLLMTCPREAGRLKWSSYVWRRGTVPIWWGVELKSAGVGEAAIVVSARNPYQGTRRSVPGLLITLSDASSL